MFQHLGKTGHPVLFCPAADLGVITERHRLMGPPESPRPRGRVWVARAFTAVEDVVYISLGLLLTASAFTLLVTGVVEFGRNVWAGKPHIIELLDRILLILLIVELLYTVQVSFREHTLVPEPFLLVGLISVIRRVLILTAEFGEMREKTELGAQYFIIELAVLTVLIVALVVSLVLLRKSGASVVAHRA
jgi:uncharacterized membrane protein (DUF373 family)